MGGKRILQHGVAAATGKPGVVEEGIIFAGGEGRELFATLAKPEKPTDSSRRGVITLHGWGGTRCGPHRIFVRIGRTLAYRGLPTLRFDFSGRGESEGSAQNITLDQMIDDAMAAREFMLSDLGCRSVAFGGICSGGNVAIGAATLGDTSRLALLSTLPFAPRTGGMALTKTCMHLQTYLRKACNVETWKRLLRGEIDTAGVARTLSSSGKETDEDRSLKDSSRDIMKQFGKTPVPSIFIYGGKDPEANAAWDYYRNFCGDHKSPYEYLVIQEANHNFYSRKWSKEVEEALVDFLCTS